MNGLAQVGQVDVVSLSLRGGGMGGFAFLGAAGGDLDDLFGWVEGEGGEHVALGFGEFGGLAERAGWAGKRDQVEAVEVGADGGPGVAGGGLDDADEEQGEPAVNPLKPWRL